MCWSTVQHFNYWVTTNPYSLFIPVTTETLFPLLQQHTYAFNQFAFVYIFNLIVGVGALALPKAFSNAGLVLGTILLILLCFVSYMTTTYMIEAMAAANAYTKLEQRKKHSAENTCPNDVQKINQVQSFTDHVSRHCHSKLIPFPPTCIYLTNLFIIA